MFVGRHAILFWSWETSTCKRSWIRVSTNQIFVFSVSCPFASNRLSSSGALTHLFPEPGPGFEWVILTKLNEWPKIIDQKCWCHIFDTKRSRFDVTPGFAKKNSTLSQMWWYSGNLYKCDYFSILSQHFFGFEGLRPNLGLKTLPGPRFQVPGSSILARDEPDILAILLVPSSTWLLHLECHSILFSNLNLIGLFSTERGKRDVENYIINWFLRRNPNAIGCNVTLCLFDCNYISHTANPPEKLRNEWCAIIRCVLLYFIKPILGNRYGSGGFFTQASQGGTHPRMRIADVPHPLTLNVNNTLNMNNLCYFVLCLCDVPFCLFVCCYKTTKSLICLPLWDRR